MTQLAFESPGVWWWGVPLAVAAAGYFYWSLTRRGYGRWRVLALLGLRGVTMLLLLVLLARPVWVEREEDESRPRRVAILLDRSTSMSLREGDESRFGQVVEFLGGDLLPEIRRRQLPSEAMLFAEEAEEADGTRIRDTQPDGEQTDLAGAIVASVSRRNPPPLAIVALTDGAATQSSSNQRAISALVQNGIPLIGVGFGSETSSRILSLERIEAPATIPSDQRFLVGVQLQVTGEGPVPPFDLVLTRNGKFVERRKMDGVIAPRYWQESFERTETGEGLVNYAVQVLPPSDSGLVCPSNELATSVRVTEESKLSVLFVQGGLTWDYKFLRLAVEGDPSIQLSALSRTANRSSFFESVQGDAELVGGFPTTLRQIGRYRVVVLSNLGPSDLTGEQQRLLDQYCGEYGGGMLVLGGPSTINGNWRGKQLEQLLPVELLVGGQPPAQGRIRVRLAEAASRQSVLRIADDRDNAGAWAQLPHFSGYARVQSVKPGAEVWLEVAGAGRQAEPLMVVQRYGRGLSAVICLQNFWRWRLAKDVEPAHFDRFWRQLLRFLSEGSRESVWLEIPSQPLEPDRDIQVEVELRPEPGRGDAAAARYTLHVRDEQQQPVHRQELELHPGQTSRLSFRVTGQGLYNLSIEDGQEVVRASRSVEIRRVSREFVKTSRDMENLRQWARLSGGLAVKVEECSDVAELIDRLAESAERNRRERPRSTPAAINGWILLLALAGVCGEWLLRKRWGLS